MGVATKSAAGKSGSKPGMKAGSKPSSKFSKSGPSSAKKAHKKSGQAAIEHKPKPTALADKKTKNGKRKPPHLKYTEAQLKVPKLNGIIPAGVSKMPNMKKGKNFVDDREGMNAIMALVMAEKEGNIESKMIKARQMEEVREARRLEMEKRAGEKREGFEERKKGIKEAGKKSKRQSEEETAAPSKRKDTDKPLKFSKPKSKRVSFG